MNDITPARPPYRTALVVTLVVLAVYVASLAPTVTFWDAGEFIAAMKILGIPHPPGTPLFVMLGHVWATILPIGEWAWRTNLMSAVFSAASAGLWFLVVHEGVSGQGGHRGHGGQATEPSAMPAMSVMPAQLAAASGSLFAAFAFTTWQNSNETEVYGLSTFLIALIAWIGLRWRAARGTRRAVELELLMVFLLALSVANHLLALLAGPAVIGFMGYTLWSMRDGDAMRAGASGRALRSSPVPGRCSWARDSAAPASSCWARCRSSPPVPSRLRPVPAGSRWRASRSR